MKLLTVYFEGLPIYKQLKTIYENSLAQAMPNVESIVLEPPKPERDRYHHHLDTAIGFQVAADYVLERPDFYVVSDVDVMWWRGIEDLQAKMQGYDIMITTRTLKRKWSSGLWAVNPTPEGLHFLHLWRHNTTWLADAVAKNDTETKRKIHPWGGIDQYAFQLTYEHLKSRTKVLHLPCCEWNAEVSCWHKLPSNCRMVHIYSKLRRELAGTKSNDPVIESLAERARSYL